MRTSIEIGVFLFLAGFIAFQVASAPVKLVRFCEENAKDRYWMNPSMFYGCPPWTMKQKF